MKSYEEMWHEYALALLAHAGPSVHLETIAQQATQLMAAQKRHCEVPGEDFKKSNHLGLDFMQDRYVSVRQLIHSGMPIDAIKALRDIDKISLEDAKKVVDVYRRS